MRWAILAASIAAATCTSAATSVFAQDNKQEEARAQDAVVDATAPPAQELRVTSPPNAAPDRHYDNASAALLEADIDYLIRDSRRNLAHAGTSDQTALWSLAVFADDFAAGRYDDARTTLSHA